MTAGYSGTPLGKKLSLKPGMRIWREAMPEAVAAEITASSEAFQLLDAPAALIDCAHIFLAVRAQLAERLALLKPLLAKGGFIWVSWPKKAARQSTDITEDVVREVCLPMGLVDVKVCAVDAFWSGLKLMVLKAP